MQEEKENTIKHVVTKEEVLESLRQYLGEKNREVLNTISPKKRGIFNDSLPVVNEKAYFVKGSEKLLNQFKAFFIAKCAQKRYEYATFMLKDYVEGLAEKNDNELFVAGSEKELLFLYLHGEASGTGETDKWMATSTLDKMANRKRKGFITVVLSERDLPIIEGSKEVRIINLGGAQKALDVESAIQTVKNKEDDTDTFVCY